MTLTKDTWRTVAKAIKAALKKADGPTSETLQGAWDVIVDACSRSGSQEVEVDRPLEWFAELFWALPNRPAEFETAVVACLYDANVEW